MNEDKIIKSILGDFYPCQVRLPQMIPKVFKANGYDIARVLRSYAVKFAIELDHDNDKLQKLDKLINK